VTDWSGGRRAVAWAVLLLALVLGPAREGAAQMQAGTYVSKDGGELDILGVQGRLFDFRIVGTVPQGDTRKLCMMEGSANMAAGVAAFDDKAAACRLSFQIGDGASLIVTQNGACRCRGGFPFQGTYTLRR